MPRRHQVKHRKTKDKTSSKSKLQPNKKVVTYGLPHVELVPRRRDRRRAAAEAQAQP